MSDGFNMIQRGSWIFDNFTLESHFNISDLHNIIKTIYLKKWKLRLEKRHFIYITVFTKYYYSNYISRNIYI